MREKVIDTSENKWSTSEETDDSCVGKQMIDVLENG